MIAEEVNLDKTLFKMCVTSRTPTAVQRISRQPALPWHGYKAQPCAVYIIMLGFGRFYVTS